MSVHVTSMVWDFRGLKAAEKLVLLRLADAANKEGDSIYPSVATIMRDTGLKEAAVRYALSDFKRSGLLVVTGRHEDWKTTIYKIDVQVLARGSIAITRRKDELKSAKGVHQVEGPLSGGG